MKVLVINCGSTSLKYTFIDLHIEKTLFLGSVARIGLESTSHRFGSSGQTTTELVKAANLTEALQIVLATLSDSPKGSLKNLEAIDAVAHRIGHGGLRYRSPVVIDKEVVEEIRKWTPVLPLHHPAMLVGIQECQLLLPEVPHVAVFDTALHRTIPDEAALYGLPYELFADRGIRKFGFHGNSHEFVAEQAARFLETPLRRLNLITCHLGGGASLCAMQRGKSIDTSMGFSPLQGLIMGTRVGDLDPGIIPFLVDQEGLSFEQVENLLNRKSGLLGLSGISSDMQEILAAAESGNSRALLAIKAFCYRVKLYIGAYLAAMGGVDGIVFTGGIGQNSRGIRARSVQGLEKLGIAIDPLRNDRCVVNEDHPVFDLSARYSQVTVLAVATNEALMIARHCAQALDYKRSIHQHVLATDPRPIRVAVSAHHIHLCQRDLNLLFGEGYQLTQKAPLYIDSQYACEETVDLIGPRGQVERVRILGPLRKKTQVEISRTEEFILGIDAPIRASGDLDGTPGLTLVGPAGRVELPEGVICAKRHIHMTPEDAENYGVQHGDKVMVQIEGERKLIFGDVLIRVSPQYKLEMHIDTDEANAAELPRVSQGYLVMIESREAEADRAAQILAPNG